MSSPIGRALVIANPASRSGRGKAAAANVRAFLEQEEEATNGFEVVMTQAPGDAEKIVVNRFGGDEKDLGPEGAFDTVIALGGDGVIHETIGGLMRVSRDRRPRFGIIPMGSGNDFARTLGMYINAPMRALGQLIAGSVRTLDLGIVNGVYFMETLSFGLDAAIALDTMTKRADNKSGKGAQLFASSAIKTFSSSREGWTYTAEIDGARHSGRESVFAVQVGPTYGGGFRICPDASPADGLLSVCYTLDIPPTIPATLALLGRARFGLHKGSKYLRFAEAEKIVVDFDVEPPCQVDGERLCGTHFEIESVPAALDVIVPKGFKY